MLKTGFSSLGNLSLCSGMNALLKKSEVHVGYRIFVFSETSVASDLTNRFCIYLRNNFSFL